MLVGGCSAGFATETVYFKFSRFGLVGGSCDWGGG